MLESNHCRSSLDDLTQAKLNDTIYLTVEYICKKPNGWSKAADVVNKAMTGYTTADGKPMPEQTAFTLEISYNNIVGTKQSSYRRYNGKDKKDSDVHLGLQSNSLWDVFLEAENEKATVSAH